MTIDRDVFFARARANPFGGSMTQRQVDGCNFILDQWELRHGNKDPRWLAYCLATAKWETGHTMQPIEEWGRVRDPQDRPGLRRPRRRAAHLGSQLREDGQPTRPRLVNHPELPLDPKVAADIMFIGMEHGQFTGVGRPTYFNEVRDDPVNARRIINGMDHAEDIAAIHAGFFAGLQP